MNKKLSVLLGSVLISGMSLVVPLAASAVTTSTTATTTIMVMKHLCGSGIEDETDLNGGATTTLGKFIKAEVACPTTALPGDLAATSSISAARTSFGFTVAPQGLSSSILSGATYVQDNLCENEVNMDLDNDGNATSSSDCLDASSYRFQFNNLPATTSSVTVTETAPPVGYHFGMVMFTPDDIMSNNDVDSLVSMSASSTGTGKIILNTATDTDHMIMLHVFNFRDTGTSTATSTATSTPSTGTTTPTTTPTSTPPILFNGSIDNNSRDVLIFAISRMQDIQATLANLLSQILANLNR
jgi:hypothetical protein